ncbi:MAG: hypothetical protein LC108_03025 [Anaerolineales bacterium]|nr:hypothetical protein [Anaerolineales bacterium]
MNTKKLPILLAILALVFSTLACASGEPGLSNVRTALDADGKNQTSTFSSTDTIYVVGEVSNGLKGNVVSSKWLVDNVEGYESGSEIDSSDLTLDADYTDYIVNFYFQPPDGGWPAGSYKVEIYFNGALNTTLTYTVQ